MKKTNYFFLLPGILLLVFLILQMGCKKDNGTDDPPPVNDTLSIPESTQVVPQNDWNNYFMTMDTSEYTFVFDEDILKNLKFEAGDILVSATPPGYLRKVTGVTTQNGQVTLTTSFASISDAVENGSFSISEALTPDKILKVEYYADGVYLDTTEYYKNGNLAILYDIDTYLDPDHLVHLTGSFDITSSIYCELEIKWFNVETFDIGFEVGESLELEAIIELLNIGWDKEVTLSSVTFTPIVAMIGPVPVIIIPELEIIAGVELNIESEVTSGLSQQVAYTAGLLYENNDWSTYSDFTKNLSYQLPELTATANAKAYIRPQLNLMFYGTVSPYLFGQLYGRIEADIQNDPWWILYGGAALGAGVKVEILGNNLLNYETAPPIIQYELELLNSNDIFVNQPPQIPSNPVPQNGLINVPINQVLTWYCSDPDDDPLVYDIYFGTASNPPLIGSNLTEANFNPGSLDQSQLYYWKVVAKDDHDHSTPGPVWSFTTTEGGSNQAPALPSNPMPSDGATDIAIDATLQWSCTDPENDPLTFNVFFGTTNPPPIVETNTSEFTYEAFGLDNNTKYYWKIDATDDHNNTTPGIVWNFTTQSSGGSTGEPCPGIPTITYEGQVYNTVLIGSQCWLKENLNVGTMISGSQNQTNNGVIEKYCYNNNASNCETYGGLYQWDEAMQYSTQQGVQGICPPGWHIPTDDEWKILDGTVDSQYGVGNPVWNYTGWRGFDAGKNLKSTSGWSSNGNGTDLYGFSALPGGLRFFDESFLYLGNDGNWWSSTESDGSRAWYRYLDSNNDGVYRLINNKSIGRSLRCLKD